LLLVNQDITLDKKQYFSVSHDYVLIMGDDDNDDNDDDDNHGRLNDDVSCLIFPD